jgi:hypothetical protein
VLGLIPDPWADGFIANGSGTLIHQTLVENQGVEP